MYEEGLNTDVVRLGVWMVLQDRLGTSQQSNKNRVVQDKIRVGDHLTLSLYSYRPSLHRYTLTHTHHKRVSFQKLAASVMRRFGVRSFKMSTAYNSRHTQEFVSRSTRRPGIIIVSGLNKSQQKTLHYGHTLSLDDIVVQI